MTPYGVMAAARTPRAERRNYTRVFARDASLCAFGMVVSGDPWLRDMAGVGLLSLAERQADNGQIPNYIDPDSGDADFWYLGCIDATLWWLAAAAFFDRHAPDALFGERLRGSIERALGWLLCQEHPGHFLLQQNEASDWADVMPRSGYVLYTNALWYHVKRVYGLARAEETKANANGLFLPASGAAPGPRRLRLLARYLRNGGAGEGRGELYASFVNFSFWGGEGDVFGNLLAVLFGLADEERAGRILRALMEAEVDRPHPVRAVCAPIRRGDPLWRPYMDRHRQNGEHRYHNGGAWPFLGGVWVAALAHAGRVREAEEALDRLAKMNGVGRWGFREWFHGVTGEPQGMPGQSWNAAMFLLARHSLEGRVFP